MHSVSAISDDYHHSMIQSTGTTKPNLSVELAELLIRLDLSSSVLLEEDALAIDKNSSCSSGAGSLHNADIAYGYPEQFSTTNIIERKILLEELAKVRTESDIHMARNNFFHDQLVEHFKRKEMMRVYREPNEADPLKHKYEKKLSKYKELREELQAGEEYLKDEVNLLKEDFHRKLEQADAALEDLVSKERAAGAQAFTNGKPLAAKEIQSLIARELGKIKEISKIRVRYARLRDSLVEKEIVFDALNILSPNLDQKDYERLEAENFYYKHKLRTKENETEILKNRRDRVIRELKVIRQKRNNVSRVILRQGEIFAELKLKIAAISHRRQIKQRKMKEIKTYFEKFESTLGLRLYPEIHAKMKDVQSQHEEWLEKIANLMEEIKKKDRYLKNLEQLKIPHVLTEVPDGEDSDENIPLNEKSRRPPLGGGFLQAL